MTAGPARSGAPLVVNGWSLYAHPLFLDQLEELIGQVEARKQRDPGTWRTKNCTKKLAAIFKLVTGLIPSDPGAPAFRQGGTLGDGRKHWFRAKFFQQYRLFYRFSSEAKIIVFVSSQEIAQAPHGLDQRLMRQAHQALAPVNDEDTLRAYGSRTDAYAVFKGMLDSGNPPDTLDALLREAAGASARFEAGLKAAQD